MDEDPQVERKRVGEAELCLEGEVLDAFPSLDGVVFFGGDADLCLEGGEEAVEGLEVLECVAEEEVLILLADFGLGAGDSFSGFEGLTSLRLVPLSVTFDF